MAAPGAQPGKQADPARRPRRAAGPFGQGTQTPDHSERRLQHSCGPQRKTAPERVIGILLLLALSQTGELAPLAGALA
eukprot:5532193-Alexandrium_andersonii.AAC.1